ncbi:uncharacterized protein [Hetaerina americana]|uniref:uncharacterized protein n=1 Tax=Hetaerina americana TaxID=62018 RepID=UPI003A7F36A0
MTGLSPSVEPTALPDRLEDSQRWVKEEKAHWQAMVVELEGQVEAWKREAEMHSDAVSKSEKERATWLGRIAEFQQRLEEHTTDLEGLKRKLKDSECRFAEEEEKRRAAEGEREELRAALQGALKEKSTLDGAVECIRDDFERVRKSFELMKSILAQREKELADMKAICCKNQAGTLGLEQLGEGGGKEMNISESDLQKDEALQNYSVNVVRSVESSDVQCAKDFNDDKMKSVKGVSEPSKISESSSVGASPCCLASMERVDFEWRQKYRTNVRTLIKKLNQKQKKLTESEHSKRDILDPVKGSKLPFSKNILPFEMLPVPSKFNDSVIMQLISKGQEVIEKSNISSASTLKSSLISLEEEVSNLENKIRLTFSSEHNQRGIKTTDFNSVEQ